MFRGDLDLNFKVMGQELDAVYFLSNPNPNLYSVKQR